MGYSSLMATKLSPLSKSQPDVNKNTPSRCTYASEGLCRWQVLHVMTVALVCSKAQPLRRNSG